jgi:hypothetical protein
MSGFTTLIGINPYSKLIAMGLKNSGIPELYANENI